MSFIESLLEEKVSVCCQTDEEFKITSNQCSWCAGEFALNYKKFIEFYISNKEQYCELYRKCVENGTNSRKTFGIKTYGENIDNEVLLQTLNLKCKIHLSLTYESNTQKSEEYINILPEDLKSEFYSKSYIFIQNFSIVSSYKFIMISRHGLSLTMIPFFGRFLVLDPHVHYSGVMTRENAEKYIKYQITDSDDSYVKVTLLCGSV